MCWAAYDFLSKNAEKLRRELVTHAKVNEKEAEEILTRQRADFTSHMPTILASEEHLQAAVGAIKPVMDAQMAMAIAMDQRHSNRTPAHRFRPLPSSAARTARQSPQEVILPTRITNDAVSLEAVRSVGTRGRQRVKQRSCSSRNAA